MISTKPLEKSTFFFGVTDMTSSRCASAVLMALMAVDHFATVRIDLPMRRVEIEASRDEPIELKDAITNAGFTPVRQRPTQLLAA